MRFSYLALAVVFALTSWPALAEEAAQADLADAAEASPEAAVTATGADEEDVASEPASAQATSEEAATESSAPSEMELGPVGVDAHGHAGRIHVVQIGDTLWDISDAYLGTPWVWPSVWQHNDAIANPHLIYPGDRVWVSPHEMRKISAAEADMLMAGADEMPAAMEYPDAMHQFGPRPVFRYSEIQTTGFVSLAEIAGAAAIVDSTERERIWLSGNTPVLIGLGAGQTAVGDQFEIFRTGERVNDPESGDPVGYLTEQLGWLEVTAVHDESASAMIKLSRSEIKRGDHLLPRRIRNRDIEVMGAPDVVGQVMHTPNMRIEMAQRDHLYLNRGLDHGVRVGSPLEVYRPLEDGFDEAQQVTKKLPDHVIAKMIVVDVHDETSVAVLTHTTRALSRGDFFRGAGSLAP